jgi:hypothetical protein
MKFMSDAVMQFNFDGESDDALLLPRPERHKRYTAEQAKNLDWKEDAIVVMLASGVIPLEVIAQTVHVNFRTVQAIFKQNLEAVGQNAQRFSAYALGKSAAWMGLADQKADKASPKDLMIMSGIARDSAINLRIMNMSGDDGLKTIEAETVAPEVEAIRKLIAERAAKKSDDAK